MSYSYTKDPKRLREEARSFASDKKGPGEVWSALKSWASDRGPVAVKAAVFEFLERYGTRPEAVPIFPEVLQQASKISPSLKRKERKHLVELADCASLTAKGGPALQPAINPKGDRLLNMPVSGSRPDPSLFFRPAETSKLPQLGNVGPLVPSSDVNQLIKARDAMLNVNERLHELPTPPKTPRKKEHKQSPEIMSFSMPVDSSKSLEAGKKGEELIRSLIDKMKEHAKEEHEAVPSPKVERAKTARVKQKKKKSEKAKPKKEEIVKKVKVKSKKRAKKRKALKKVAPKKEKATKKTKVKLRPRPKSKPKKKKPKKVEARPKKERPKPKPKPKKKIVRKRPAKKKAKKKILKKTAKRVPKPKKKAKKKTPKKPRKKKAKPKKKKGKKK